MSTYATAFAQTHSIVFLSDNLRNTLRDVVREYGLNPDNLMQRWPVIERGIKKWLDTQDLTAVVIEFYKPGATVASARWDLPVSYTGSGVDDDMWLDKNYLRQLIAKAAKPTSDCLYRVVLAVKKGAPEVEGFSDCPYLNTGALTARQSGTVIATAHMTVAATYWR